MARRIGSRFAVVVEERLHQVEVAAGQQRPVEQPLVLVGEAAAPEPVVLVREPACRPAARPRGADCSGVGVGLQTQLLREQAAVELGLDPPAALAGHQEAEDVVALRGQRRAVLLLADAARRGLAVELLAGLRRQRVVGGDDPTPLPEARPTTRSALPSPWPRRPGCAALLFDGLDPRLGLRRLHGQRVDADVERLSACRAARRP